MSNSKRAGMTGPEHFLAGEHALQQSEMIDFSLLPDSAVRCAALAAQAQAHFTAANTLAMSMLTAVDAAESDDVDVANEWVSLLGIETVAE